MSSQAKGRLEQGQTALISALEHCFGQYLHLPQRKQEAVFAAGAPARHGRNYMFFWALLVRWKRVASFSYSFPLWFITVCGIQFPVLCSRSLLAIYFIYSSVYLLYRITCIA